MNYDRDEWRRPWRSGEGPSLAVDQSAAADGAPFGAGAPPMQAESVQGEPEEPAEPPEQADPFAPAEPSVPAEPSGESEPVQTERSGWAEPPVDAEPVQTERSVQTEPAQGDSTHAEPAQGESLGQPEPPLATTQLGATNPIARYPQPPPAGWGEQQSGPGSPAGSVRPPDTTGTVDAPANGPKRRGVAGVLLVALLGGVVGAGAVVGMQTLLDDEPTEPADGGQTVAAPTIEPLTEGSVVPAVAEAVTPSVVRIDVNAADGGPMPGMGGGLGSGVIYRSDGYVLTNHHVIEAADDVIVRLASGEVLEAEVVGSDELNDIAVLEVDGGDLPAINVRPSEDEPLVVGETVVAIGSPFGLDTSVTTGIISALDREIRLDEADAAGGVLTIPSVLQTDAAINPGNSGGALVDAQGRLVGVNTAILSRTGASQGVGFAVSAEQALTSADQLIEQGFVRHPLLGITGIDVTPDVAEQFDLSANQGAIVESVQEGTGADDADIRPGDLIVEVNGEQLATMGELVAEVRRRAPGDSLTLDLLRDGEELTVDVELGERPR